MMACEYLLGPEAIGRGQASEKRGPADDPEPECGPDATESQASEADGPEPEFGPDATRRGRTSEADGPEPELGSGLGPTPELELNLVRLLSSHECL